MNTIYTAGYQGWTVETLRAACAERGALLVDIRMNPTSTRAEWRKEALRHTFGSAYHHAPALGNRNYQGGPIELAAPARAVPFMTYALARTPVVLLCACRDWRSCHRSVAAAFLSAELGAPVEHLEPPVSVAPGAIPALTVRQPWAWVIFTGKDIENRTWATSYRGPLAIHAGKGMTRAEYASAATWIRHHVGREIPAMETLTRGAVLGTVELLDCVTESDSPWFDGSGYGWQLASPRLLPEPVPATGAQGLWSWEPPS